MIRTGIADTEVPEPVGRGGHGHGFSADVEREDLAGDDPSNGTPGGGEESDVDTDESNKCLLTGLILNGDGDTDDSHKVLADAHADSAD